ncbi:MAG: tetratricopeptide repeat protein [Acidobacteria bacterium]|nr:tetratricopeptide repeat protein [Acidobacteriota bacterium]
MSVILPFPNSSKSKGLQRIQSTYTVRDISRRFGLSESSIRRWTRKGIIEAAVEETQRGELRYDFHALTQFRRIRELRNRGLTIRQIESELHGQMNLFPESGGRLIPLPVRRSPFEEALLLHEQGDERAVKMYNLAIVQGECVSDAYCNLGILEFENNETARAFDHFTNGLKNDPRHFESHFNLAHLYFEAGDYRLARLHYEISGVLEPNSAGVHYNLGLIYAVSGELTEAIEAMNKAKEHSTGEELAQVEELLLNLKKAARDNKQPKNPQELLPDNRD